MIALIPFSRASTHHCYRLATAESRHSRQSGILEFTFGRLNHHKDPLLLPLI